MKPSNQLYYGDNLDVLQNSIQDESIDLCYIDPPFNSNRDYNRIYNNTGKEDSAQATAFTDTWEWDKEAIKGFRRFSLVRGDKKIPEKTKLLINSLHKILDKGSMLAYIVSISQRIVEIHRVLKPTGSFYLHCDPKASHYLKIIIDSIFCTQGGEFKNEIVWRRHYSHNDGKKFGCIHDIILYYAKSDEYTYNRQYFPYTEEYITENYKSAEEESNRRYRSVSMNAPGQGDAKYFGDKLLAPPKGTHWRWTQDKINEGLKNGIIYFTKNGVPRYKQYLDEMNGIPVQDTWTDFYGLSSHDKERLGYPTQKPERLLERIILASSGEKDVVLDAYCGCGTTVAVAQRLKRKWIGIDITYQSIYVILKRLEDSFGKKVISHIELSGIPRDIESAKALAHKKEDKTRKEFEKWAIITYSNDKAKLNEKKGSDKGIDGKLNFYWDFDKEIKDVLFSVKSGHVSVSQIRDFLHVIEREKAAAGVFITLEEPTKPMLQEAKDAGSVTIPLTGQSIDKLQIVTVRQILDGARAGFPLAIDPLKKAERKIEDNQTEITF